eukprot:TRINITY_DN1573_c0_g2_i2.p1 TRINITY_DN1573_c0_g2~~TRINITY_DN1573_c0_g2_i2.p1  ORF type:complete len:919 (+),score=146.83 TRINITY_DN1573_c0_g2_i2:169-2925(+)
MALTPKQPPRALRLAAAMLALSIAMAAIAAATTATFRCSDATAAWTVHQTLAPVPSRENPSAAPALRPQPLRIHTDVQIPSNLLAPRSALSALVHDVIPAVQTRIAAALSLPSAPFPPINTTLTKECLQLDSVTGECLSFAQQTKCGQATVAAQHLDGGVGVPADFVLFVTYQTSTQLCPSGKLLNAQVCHRSAASDRPMSGSIDFCPGFLSLAYDTQRNAVLHTLLHHLGLHEAHMPYWRDVYGAPRVQRDSKGVPVPVSQPGNGTMDTVFKTFQERGVSVRKLVTPESLKSMKTHTGCSSLNGVELEGPSTAVRGHWEARTHLGEVMTAAVDTDSVLSSITMGALSDSGWYLTNMMLSQTLLWGHKQGCDAATQKCINNGVSVDQDMFCTAKNSQTEGPTRKCSADRKGFGDCNLMTYATSIRPEFAYFSSDKLGGSDTDADYCPYIQPAASGLCDSDSASIGEIDDFGSTHGPDTYCMESTLASHDVLDVAEARCYRADCVQELPQAPYRVRISVGSQVRVCGEGEASVTFSGFTGEVLCPPISAICPERSCACSAGAVCVEGECVCPLGNCATDCVLSDWSPWDTCSAECGDGTQTRSRQVVSAPRNGGASCGAVFESRACNLGPCWMDDETPMPTSPTYTWLAGDWSECEPYCKRGLKTREVKCVHAETSEQVVDCFCDSFLRPEEESNCEGDDLPDICTSRIDIGPEGGEVYHEEFMSLVFPEGAINNTVTIFVRTYESHEDVDHELYSDPIPDGVEIISPVFEFGPSGLHFLEPAEIRIVIEKGKYDSHDEYAVFVQSQGGVWEQAHHSNIHKEHDEIYLVSELEHFSIVAGFRIKEEEPDIAEGIRNAVILVLGLLLVLAFIIWYTAKSEETFARLKHFDWNNIGRSLRGLCMPAPDEVRNRTGMDDVAL